MNKKALFYNIGLVLVFTAVLTSAFLVLEIKKDAFDGKVGELQFRLIKTYQEVEDRLFRLDWAAKSGLSHALYDLAHTSGYIASNKCGSVEVSTKDPKAPQWIRMWSRVNGQPKDYITCFPQENKVIEPNLKTLLKREWEILPAFLGVRGIYQFAEDNPKITYSDEGITSTYKSSLRLEKEIEKELQVETGYFDEIPTTAAVAEPEDKSTETRSIVIGKYSANPSFKVTVPYNLSDYEAAEKHAQNIIEECSLELEPSECVFKEIKGKKFLNIDCEQPKPKDHINPKRIFPVCFPTEQILLQGKPHLRFALYIPDRKKPDIAFGDLFSLGTGVFDFTSLISDLANLQGLNLDAINIFQLPDLTSDLPSLFTQVGTDNKYSLSSGSQQYSSDNTYFLNLRLNFKSPFEGQSGNEFDYRVKIDKSGLTYAPEAEKKPE